MKKIILFFMGLAIAALVLSGCQPGKAAQLPNVVAKSCDGDPTCETNTLFVDQDATIQGALTSWQTTTGRIIISSLTGKGNSYACLDEQGLIFRSDTPCR